MPRRRQKRKIVKQSELLQILKYLIPKQGITKTIAGDINPLAFQTGRGGYSNPYLLKSAEQQVVQDTNKAYITIKTDTPQLTIDNKMNTGIIPSGDVKTDIKRKTDFVKGAFANQNLPYLKNAHYETYGGGNIPKTYEAIINGTFNWIRYKEFVDTRNQPEKKKERKQNN